MNIAETKMNTIDSLKKLLKAFNEKQHYKNREMKRVFQWKRYLEWNNLTNEERVSAKRILFLPIFAYILLSFFNQNFLMIIILLTGYIMYKKNEKGKLTK